MTPDQGRISSMRRAAIFRFAPLFIWIGIIFFLSSNNGSMTETSLFIGPLLHFLFPDASEATIQAYHGFIRKCAHFAVYFVLAVLAVRSLRPMSSLWKFAAVLAVVASVASLDEFNQSFEASRTSSAWDVALDCVGGVAGIAVATLLYKRFSRSERWPVS